MNKPAQPPPQTEKSKKVMLDRQQETKKQVYHKPSEPFVSLLTFIAELDPSTDLRFYNAEGGILAVIRACRTVNWNVTLKEKRLLFQHHEVDQASKQSMDIYRDFEIKLVHRLRELVSEIKKEG